MHESEEIQSNWEQSFAKSQTANLYLLWRFFQSSLVIFHSSVFFKHRFSCHSVPCACSHRERHDLIPINLFLSYGNANKRIRVCFGAGTSDESAYKYSQLFPFVNYTQIHTGQEGEETRRLQGYQYHSVVVMEYRHEYSANSSSKMVKETRLPPKRGHVKIQIARKLSNIMLPSSAAGDTKQADRNSFRRETSYNDWSKTSLYLYVSL